ncbi:MAG: glycosyltransferase family 4 protein [bacterium]|nr:glycosyltransferase family 4 protein [bacterium]
MSERNLKVLAICPFPAAFPSTRYRLLQYVGPLKKMGIEVELRPFLDADEHRRYFEDPRLLKRLSAITSPLIRRFTDVVKAAGADVVLIQREAMPFGPGFFEWMFHTVGRKPLVLDIDDAVYIPYEAGRYGRLGSFLKFYGKTDRLIRSAHAVVCGGDFLAEYAERKGGRAVVIPTTVDKDVFKPTERAPEIPVIGWIGTPSSFPYLKAILPALERLADKHRFKLLLRGSGEDNVAIDGIEIDSGPWSMQTEVEDFRSIDIGLYPLVENEHQPLEFIQGKSGFKAIQYLALGIPFVVSPLGVAASIGVAGRTHFEATTVDEWVAKLDILLTDRALRLEMGELGRQHFLEKFDLESWAGVLAGVLRSAAASRKTDRSEAV